MSEEKNSRLPEELGHLIHKDIEVNLARFDESGFEQKLFDRIRDRKISFKWALIPASLVLVIGILLVNTGRKGLPGPGSLTDQFRSVLKTVSPDQSYTATGPLLHHAEFPETENSTTIEELTVLIRSAIRTVEGASEVSISCCKTRERDHTGHLSEGIRSMNRKNDYSELFSRIIDKLTEG